MYVYSEKGCAAEGRGFCLIAEKARIWLGGMQLRDFIETYNPASVTAPDCRIGRSKAIYHGFRGQIRPGEGAIAAGRAAAFQCFLCAIEASPAGFITVRALPSVTVQAGEDFLLPGQAQAHGGVGGIADGRKPAFADLVGEKLDNLPDAAAGEELLFHAVAHHLG